MVELAVPAARRGHVRGVLHRRIGEVFVAEVLIEVAGQVDD